MSTDRTLSGLPAADGLSDEDTLLVTQSGRSKKVAVAIIKETVDQARPPAAVITSGAPTTDDGTEGALALDLRDGRVYGPKAAGEWSTQVWRAACTGGRVPNNGLAATDAKIMSCNVRYSVVSLSAVKLVASNFTVDFITGDSSTDLGLMTVHATVCWPTKDDVLGDATWTVPPGQSGASPVIELSETIPAGEKVFIGWYATPAAGTKLPLFQQRGFDPDNSPNIELGEAVEVSSGAPDKTSALSTIVGVEGHSTFGPSAVLALQPDTNPCVAILGGSIATEVHTGWDEYNNPGWLSGAFGMEVATVNMARGTSRGAQCLTNGGMRLALAQLCGATHVIIEYGFNDWVQGATADEVIAMRCELGELWLAAGIKPAITTVTPANTSTDSFATIENQGHTVPPGPRQIINAAARRVPAPFIACIEAADAVEPYRDSTFYKPGHTDDGRHPSPDARADLIAAVDTSVFRAGYLTTDFGRGRPDPTPPYPAPIAGKALQTYSNGALFWGSVALEAVAVEDLGAPGPIGSMVAVTDGDANKPLVISDGSHWRFADGQIARPQLEAETAAILSAFEMEPDTTRIITINTLVSALKDAGVWSTLDALYLLAAHDAQAARINWIEPDGAELTLVSEPVFIVDRGYAGDGVDDILETGLMVDGLTNLSPNSIMIGSWELTNAANFFSIGLGGAGVILRLNPLGNTGVAGGRCNDASGVSYSTATSLGFTALDRSGANSRALYRNGVSVLSDGVSSLGALPNEELLLFADANGGGGGAVYAARHLSAAVIGGSQTGKHAELYAALLAYHEAVGAV